MPRNPAYVAVRVPLLCQRWLNGWPIVSAAGSDMPDTKPNPSSAESCPGREACAVCRAMGLRDGLRAWFGGNDTRAKRDIAPHLLDLSFPPSGPLDLVVITALDRAEADYFHAKLTPRLMHGASVWASIREGQEKTIAVPQNEAAHRVDPNGSTGFRSQHLHHVGNSIFGKRPSPD